METRIRPLSSPWSLGFAVFGRLTSGPLRMRRGIPTDMLSSTSPTWTSRVMLMAACNLTGSPSRIGRSPLLAGYPIDFLDHDLRHLDLRYFEQAVHQLGRSPAHL